MALLSKYRGVRFNKKAGEKGKPWIAEVKHDFMQYHLGTFDTEEEASERFLEFEDNYRGGRGHALRWEYQHEYDE